MIELDLHPLDIQKIIQPSKCGFQFEILLKSLQKSFPFKLASPKGTFPVN